MPGRVAAGDSPVATAGIAMAMNEMIASTKILDLRQKVTGFLHVLENFMMATGKISCWIVDCRVIGRRK